MRALALLLAVFAWHAQAADKFAGIGRGATPAEIQAWDIDVRPDFKGLPPGSGSVEKGQHIWETKCASCHGVFGEATDVFSPIVGGTTNQDIATGRVANLLRADYPQRTTLMKVATLSTLWDYINRAMPWNAPKSLSADEVYAVTAYILNLGDILPDDFVLSDKNIRDVQNKLPNRNGAYTFEPLWNARGKGDTRNTLCMKNCVSELRVASAMPEYAMNAHGNLAEQNRVIGEVRGIDTARAGRAVAAVPKPHAAEALIKKYNCSACHAIDRKLVGPGFTEVARRYAKQADAAPRLSAKIRQGGSGEWGAIPMPPNSEIPAADLEALVHYVLGAASPESGK